MSGATPGGWPYVTPDDHPISYPAFSQQFAQFADTKTAHEVLPFTPTAPWVEFGGSYTSRVTRQGSIVVMNIIVKPTADTAFTTSAINIGNVTGRALPINAFVAPGTILASGGLQLARCFVNGSGLLSVFAAASGTVTAASGQIAFSIAYRGA